MSVWILVAKRHGELRHIHKCFDSQSKANEYMNLMLDTGGFVEKDGWHMLCFEMKVD